MAPVDCLHPKKILVFMSRQAIFFGERSGQFGPNITTTTNSKKKDEVVALFGVVGLGMDTVSLRTSSRHHSKRNAAKHHDRLTFCIPLASQRNQTAPS
jgi:hypothetical protein